MFYRCSLLALLIAPAIFAAEMKFQQAKRQQAKAACDFCRKSHKKCDDDEECAQCLNSFKTCIRTPKKRKSTVIVPNDSSNSSCAYDFSNSFANNDVIVTKLDDPPSQVPTVLINLGIECEEANPVAPTRKRKKTSKTFTGDEKPANNKCFYECVWLNFWNPENSVVTKNAKEYVEPVQKTNYNDNFFALHKYVSDAPQETELQPGNMNCEEDLSLPGDDPSNWFNGDYFEDLTWTGVCDRDAWQQTMGMNKFN